MCHWRRRGEVAVHFKPWCYMRLCVQHHAPAVFSQGEYKVVYKQIKLDVTGLYACNDLVHKTKTRVAMHCQKKKKSTKLSLKQCIYGKCSYPLKY
jgi:hypothetical protein